MSKCHDSYCSFKEKMVQKANVDFAKEIAPQNQDKKKESTDNTQRSKVRG